MSCPVHYEQRYTVIDKAEIGSNNVLMAHLYAARATQPVTNLAQRSSYV